MWDDGEGTAGQWMGIFYFFRLDDAFYGGRSVRLHIQQYIYILVHEIFQEQEIMHLHAEFLYTILHTTSYSVRTHILVHEIIQ